MKGNITSMVCVAIMMVAGGVFAADKPATDEVTVAKAVEDATRDGVIEKRAVETQDERSPGSKRVTSHEWDLRTEDDMDC